jgi:signal transduction histidine kinase
VADIKAQITADQRRMLDSTLRTLLMISLVATAGVGALSAGLGWIVAGRLIRPLQTITGTARGVAGGSLHSRIRMSGPADELKELADTFDAMLERLDRAFDGQRRFVANASHELRTPLAVTRTLIQVAMGRADAPPGLRELGGKLLEVNDRQVRMTDALLTLARTEDALTDVEPVDLARVAAHSARALAEDARTAAVRMRTELASARTTGDPVLLDQLVGNLLRNAVQHNVGGGWVLAQTGADATTCWITVTNTGAELTAGDADEIFEPFRRLSGRAGRTDHTGGVGLGLSIVRSITHAHGGRVEARPRDGGGLTVRVELPVAG